MIDLAGLVAKLSPEARTALARRLAADVPPAPPEPIAIVGVGCRYPGGVASADDLWRLVTDGRDAVGPVPTDRWDTTALDRLGWEWGGFLDDVAGFDAGFFGISPHEAAAMDPQQRLLVEITWEALEHAGIPARGLAGSKTGIFVGIAAADYLIERLKDPEALSDPYTIVGTAHSTAVGRLSYLLDLRGPSVALDTACSSSLVSVHLACQSLRSGDSDLAIAGGVHVLSSPATTIAMGSAEVAPSDGRVRSFDASARGTVRAEGAGMIVLKRLADAERDGDRVLAVVRGSAVNQDGHSNGLTAPSAVAQRAVLADAVARAGVPAGSIGLVETHGTGTVLGDPIEVEALTPVYGAGDGRCALGAVKSNLGHCEEAAGVAGLIKAVESLRHAQIPPNLHFTALNPNISFEGTRFYVPTANDSWPVPDGPRRAAVSSFGMGGTNAHIVLEQAPDVVPAPVEPARPRLVLLSGAVPAGLSAQATALADWADGPGADVPFADVAATAGRHRSHAGERLAIVASGDTALPALLRGAAAGDPGAGIKVGVARGSVSPAIRSGAGTVFVFSGFGAHWPGMGRELLANEPAFAAAIDELDPVHHELEGSSLRDLLAAEEWNLQQVPQLVYAVQVGLAAVWRAYGVTPAAVVGHSIGEIAAAVVAGVLTPAEGVRVVAARNDVLRPLVGTGAMALVGLPADEVTARLADVDGVEATIWASPSSTVVSTSDVARLDELVAGWEAEGLLARKIPGATGPGHTAAVDPMLPAMASALADLHPTAARLDVYSTARLDPRAGITGDARYWAANVRNPVRFTAAVAAAAADGYRAFVEISSHPLVTHALEETLAAAGDTVVAHSLRRDKPERSVLLAQLGVLHCAGVPVDLARAVPGGTLADLPTTVWQHRAYWYRLGVGGAADTHPLLGVHVRLPEAPVRHVWQAQVRTDQVRWLADHRYEDLPVMPGTGYVEIALAAACEAYGVPPTQVTLADVEYQAPLLLAEPVTLTTTLVEKAPGDGFVEIGTGDGPARTLHAVARVRIGAPVPPAALDLAALTAAHTERVDPTTAVYAPMRAIGQIHGPAFVGLRELALRRGASEGSDTDGPVTETLARVSWPEDAVRDPRLHLHPAFLDTSFHGAIAAVPDTSGAFYLPTGMRELRVHGDLATVTTAHTEVGAELERGFSGTVRLLDATGAVVVEAVDLAIREVAESSLPVSLAGKLYERFWDDVALPADLPEAAAGGVLVVGDPGAVAGVAPAFGYSDFDSDSDSGTGLAAALAGPVPPAHVVVLARAGQGGDPAAEAERLVLDVARVAAALARREDANPPRLWVVTRGAQVVDGETPELVQSGLRGLVRTLVLEQPGLRATLLDLDPADPDPAATIAAELRAGTADDEIALRGNRRLVARIGQITLPREAAPVPYVRRGGGYAISGGLTGLGITVARDLVARGAGVVALNARSAPSPDAQKAIDEMRDAGATVVVVPGDIAAPGTAEALVAAVTGAGAQLRGVLHSAAWLDDCLVTDLDAERLHRPWWPKAAGAWRLHSAVQSQADAGQDLDWWVGFSSLASLLGGPGQVNYSAASAFLDGLAQWRRAQGLPALAVNWGGWAEVGAARNLSHDAIGMMRPKEGLTALAELVGADRHVTGVARLHLGLLPEVTPEITRSSFFTRLVAAAADDAADDWAGPSALAGLSADELRRTVRKRLHTRICRIMGFTPADLPTRTPLVHLGLDSLLALRIKNAVSADFGVNLPVAIFLQGVGVAELEAAVLADLAGETLPQHNPDGTPAAPADATPAAPTRADDVRARAQERAAARRTARTGRGGA